MGSAYLGLDAPAVIVASDPVIEDPVAFAMEKHLEAFPVANWSQTELAKDFAIYEHCLPFNVARAYDEARGIDTPRIWTAERDRQMWEALQG